MHRHSSRYSIQSTHTHSGRHWIQSSPKHIQVDIRTNPQKQADIPSKPRTQSSREALYSSQSIRTLSGRLIYKSNLHTYSGRQADIRYNPPPPHTLTFRQAFDPIRTHSGRRSIQPMHTHSSKCSKHFTQSGMRSNQYPPHTHSGIFGPIHAHAGRHSI